MPPDRPTSDEATPSPGEQAWKIIRTPYTGEEHARGVRKTKHGLRARSLDRRSLPSPHTTTGRPPTGERTPTQQGSPLVFPHRSPRLTTTTTSPPPPPHPTHTFPLQASPPAPRFPGARSSRPRPASPFRAPSSRHTARACGPWPATPSARGGRAGACWPWGAVHCSTTPNSQSEKKRGGGAAPPSTSKQAHAHNTPHPHARSLRPRPLYLYLPLPIPHSVDYRVDVPAATIRFYAARDIRAGEELTISYGRVWWDEEDDKAGGGVGRAPGAPAAPAHDHMDDEGGFLGAIGIGLGDGEG